MGTIFRQRSVESRRIFPFPLGTAVALDRPAATRTATASAATAASAAAAAAAAAAAGPFQRRCCRTTAEADARTPTRSESLESNEEAFRPIEYDVDWRCDARD